MTQQKKGKCVKAGTYNDSNSIHISTEWEKNVKLDNEASEAYNEVISNDVSEVIDLSDDEDVLLIKNDVISIDMENLINIVETHQQNEELTIIDEIDNEITVIEASSDINKKIGASKDISIIELDDKNNEPESCEIIENDCIIEFSTPKKVSKKKNGSYFDTHPRNIKPNIPIPSEYDWCDVCCVYFTRNSGHELGNLHKMEEIKSINMVTTSGNSRTYAIPPEYRKTYVNPKQNNTVTTTSNNSKANAISSDNIGFKMLVAAGWKENTGLGRERNGMKTPIQTVVKYGRTGLGMGNSPAERSNFSAHKNNSMPSNSKYSNFISKKVFTERAKIIKGIEKDKKLERDIRRELSSLIANIY